jgi:hypothetical protein
VAGGNGCPNSRWVSQLPLGVQPALAEEPPVEGELFAGFVLLPEGAPMPSFVKEPALGVPNMCGVGVGMGGPEPTAVTTNFLNAADILTKIDFPPPGIISKIPLGFIVYWIQRNVFYTLVIENTPGFEECVKFLNSLELMN